MKSTLLAAAALAVPSQGIGARDIRTASADFAPRLIDTNVDLLGWPFRTLKYGKTEDLVAKLKSHRIEEAWAGSFEALFHKNVDAVNRRLVEECEPHKGFLIPFGTVNPAWPDWEEDLRRCDEEYGMTGIRLYPSFQNYTLDHPDFSRLLAAATERGMIVQIAIEMEDERVHHPRVHTPAVDVMPLPQVLGKTPHARVQLVNPFRHVRGGRLTAMIEDTNVMFDVSNLEGNGGIERVIAGNHWFLPGSVPAERLLFGTHAPYFPAENAVLKLFESRLTKDQLQQVMRDNAVRLRTNT